MIQPYYQDDFVTLYCGDCREVLPQLPKVDLVLTDPPYEYAQTGGGLIAKRKSYQKISNELSKFDPFDYWGPLKGASKTAHGYIFTSKACIGDFIRMAEAGGLNWDLLIYGKNNPAPMKNNRYLSSFELLFFFRGEGCYWNNAAPFEHFSKLKMTNCEPSQYGHPTEKDAEILGQLINVSTAAEHCILDPFAGSGTTLVAAKNLKRKAIGIEIEKKYCDIAVKRLRQEILI